jgi:hypothetical protein
MCDHLKYFTEHLPATFVYAGINVERSGLFTGVRGKRIAGRCVLTSTGAFPYQQEWKSPASKSVVRAYRAVSPSTCSEKILRSQPGAVQKNRRTAGRISTGRRPTAASASRRE